MTANSDLGLNIALKKSDLVTDAERYFLLLNKCDPSRDLLVTSVIKIDGNINQDFLENSIKIAAAENQSLRTFFSKKSGEYDSIDPRLASAQFTRHVSPEVDFQLQREVAPTTDPKDLEEFINDEEKREKVRRFDIEQTPLFNGRLIDAGKGRAFLFLTFHHSIMDAGSQVIIIDEIAQTYNKLIAGSHAGVSPKKPDYGDFLEWHFQRQSDPTLMEQSTAFWHAYLKRFQAPNLEQKPKLPEKLTANTHWVDFNLKLDKSFVLFSKNMSISYACAPIFALTAALSLHAADSRPIPVVNTISGRFSRNFQSLLGLLAKAVITIVEINPATRILDHLKTIQSDFLSGLRYAVEGLPMILNRAEKQGLVDVNYLSDSTKTKILFNYLGHTTSDPDAFFTGTATSVVSNRHGEPSAAQISLYVQTSEYGVTGTFGGWSDIYSYAAVKHMAQAFIEILRLTIEEPEATVATLLAGISGPTEHTYAHPFEE
jgi:hypothetical protein